MPRIVFVNVLLRCHLRPGIPRWTKTGSVLKPSILFGIFFFFFARSFGRSCSPSCICTSPSRPPMPFSTTPRFAAGWRFCVIQMKDNHTMLKIKIPYTNINVQQMQRQIMKNENISLLCSFSHRKWKLRFFSSISYTSFWTFDFFIYSRPVFLRSACSWPFSQVAWYSCDVVFKRKIVCLLSFSGSQTDFFPGKEIAHTWWKKYAPQLNVFLTSQFITGF